MNRKPENTVKVFEEKHVRSVWDDMAEKWWFSIVDVVAILTDQDTTRGASNYWRKLKERLKAEGHELVTNCHQLKLMAADGKMYLTDVADTEQVLRLIQSIPSKKAEPFKMWLARVGRERIDETIDPELSIERAVHNYRRLGYGEKWINQRIKTIEVRKELTDEWEKHGITDKRDFAILTDVITKTWSGKTTRQYKEYKGLKKENLRDHMTNMELALNMIAEISTTDIERQEEPNTMNEHKKAARRGGSVAESARKKYELETGKKAVSPINAKYLKALGSEGNDDNANA